MNMINEIKNISIFSGLDRTGIKKLSKIAIHRRFPKNSVIIEEGDTSTSLFILILGRAKAFSRFEEKEVVHEFFVSGDFFGEMSFIDQKPRSATVVADQDCDVLVIQRNDFFEVFLSSPEFTLNVMRGLLQRIRTSNRQKNDLFFLFSQQDLYDAHLDTIKRLVLAAKYKDDNTADHIIRVGRYSALLAEKYGFNANEVQTIRYASQMHDIGKLGIPEHILLKPGKLTFEEFAVMKTHTQIGAKILSNPRSEILKYGHEISLNHHERFDGKGYPAGLSRENTPVSARIAAIADTFDTILSRRPYKQPCSIEIALEIIEAEREKQFDPGLVDLFFENIDEIIIISKDLNSDEDVLLIEFDRILRSG